MTVLSRLGLHKTLPAAAPQGEGRELDAVAGGIAEVERPATLLPIDLTFDRHVCGHQSTFPFFAFLITCGERQVTRAKFAMGRDITPRGCANLRIEDQQHTAGAAKRCHQITGADQLQPENIAVKRYGRREIICIENRFENSRWEAHRVKEADMCRRFNHPRSGPLTTHPPLRTSRTNRQRAGGAARSC